MGSVARRARERFGSACSECPIKVTKHAYKRFCERNLLSPNKKGIQSEIERQVSRSRLFGLRNGFELRECKGNVFVCKREDRELTVITVLLSSPKKYANFGTSFI